MARQAQSAERKALNLVVEGFEPHGGYLEMILLPRHIFESPHMVTRAQPA